MKETTLEKPQQSKSTAKLPDTMKAAVFAGDQRIEVQDVALPEPKANQVLVKLEGCGVCASNIPNFEGREWFNYPLDPGAPGHEGWGHIVKKGESVNGYEVGDRVAMLSYAAYAEYDVADQDALLKINDLPENEPFPGEPLGCAMNIFKRSDIKEGQTVAIIGIGFLGALLTQLCKAKGANVIAISRRDFSLEIAKECGANHTVKMDDHWKIIEKVKELTNGELCDRAIEATGKEWPLNLSGELLKNRARLIIAGFHQGSMRSVNIEQWNWKGLDVINAHERDPEMYMQGMKDAKEALQNGTIRPVKLYTNFYTLDDSEQALHDIIKRPDGFLKAIITLA